MFARLVSAALAFVVVSLLVVSPSPAAPASSAEGMVIVPSRHGFEETWDIVVGILEGNPNIGIVAVVDHAAAAESVGNDLSPTREIFFGNPALGTPLMAINQKAGIDLPQKIVVWEASDSAVFVGYNSTKLLEVRHGVSGAATLETIAGALAAITTAATGTPTVDRSGSLHAYQIDPRLIEVVSDADVATTFDRLLGAIDAAPPSVVFTLDHAANAATVGIDLAETRLIVFGSPLLGSPLMAEHQSIAIDLPLKFLVYESDGVTRIAYNDIHAVARRHGVSGQPALLDGIAAALAGLAAAGATG